MRTVTVQDLANDPIAYLQYVRDGEEIVLHDQNIPVARILPFNQEAAEQERQARLVASGDLILPKQKMDWDAFFALRKGSVPRDAAVQAVIDDRSE